MIEQKTTTKGREKTYEEKKSYADIIKMKIPLERQGKGNEEKRDRKVCCPVVSGPGSACYWCV
jgi:hypothetical protein